MSDLNARTISELLALLEDGRCSAVDIVRDVLAAAEQTEPTVHAYLQLDAEGAMAQARASDAARAAGNAGPLCGIPIAVKDVLNVAGESCTCASRILEGYTSPYDATAIARLRAAGAVLLGRTNMDEFAMGSSTEGSAFGVTRNPWDTERVPGGSSGGSAAAVAARSAVAALGTDTGGSIRQPAAFCGCVGLKPSYGRVSRYGLTAYASSLDQIGPMTRSVGDAATVLQAIAGDDSQDATAADVAVPDYREALQERLDGMRLGMPKEYFIDGIDPETEQAVREAISVCESLGATVQEVSLPHTEYAIATYYIIATAEASANLARFDGVRYGARDREAQDPIAMHCRSREAGLGDEVKRRIILGTYVLSSGYYDAYYLRAQKVRTRIREDFESAFAACDAIVCPVTPSPAYLVGAMADSPLEMYLGDIFTATANLAGICGLSVPCGFTGGGLPVGLQVLGPAFGESAILRVGHAYESATDWNERAPKLDGVTG